MDRSLALSAEDAPAWVIADFPAGVGLLRGEYILRDMGAELVIAAVPARITEYLVTIAGRAVPAPVWYRLADLDAGEAAVLAGAGPAMRELRDSEVRGVRRGLLFPALLELELAAVRDAQRVCPNIRLLLPYVSTVDEAARVAARAEAAGIAGPLGVMAETPAAVFVLPEIIDLGYGHVLVGCNDLWALVMGRLRAAGHMPTATTALTRVVELARAHTARAGVALHMAGYHDESLLRMAEATGVDAVVYHYAQLPELLGERYADLPDAGLLADIKRRSRAAVAEMRAASGPRAVATVPA